MGKLLATNRTRLYSPRRFPSCCCVVHTHQLSAITSWPTFVCRGEGRLTFMGSFQGLMRSQRERINWPASSIWVFIGQLGEHCSANAEATGSNPVEAQKNFFSGYFRNCLNCDSLRWSHTHFTSLFSCQISLSFDP